MREASSVVVSSCLDSSGFAAVSVEFFLRVWRCCRFAECFHLAFLHFFELGFDVVSTELWIPHFVK